MSPAQLSNNGVLTNGVKSLVDVLLASGVLTLDKAKLVKEEQVQSGAPQEEIIRNKKFVKEIDLVKAKAALYNIPFIDLSTAPVATEAIYILPRENAEKLRVYPFALDKTAKVLSLAMSDPLNLSAIEFIEKKTGYRVKAFAAEPEKIDESINSRYLSSLSQQVTEAVKEVSGDKDIGKLAEIQKTGFIREEKVAEIVTHVLDFAIRGRASDIHIEPQEKQTRVRYRIDGILQEKLTVPKALHDALVSRIKILSGMKIDEKRVPQDGRFNFTGAGEIIDLRVSSLPTTWGEKIVMRLLKKTGGVPSLNELGLRGVALKNLEEAILRPHGIIIICGPTGSGKTTTLYSIISRINTPRVNIVTLEDPIEYKIEGVNQVQVNPAAGLTFASGLRSFLRQDPNIILVGEIRDRETADLAIQASLTGHLVFSTLHTNDACSALPRLLDMGAEPYLLASSMTAIVAQRVVRKIHPECREAYKPDPLVFEDMKNVLGTLWPKKEPQELYKGKGDDECASSGYYGRIGIFEVLPVSEKISRLILERTAASEIEKVARLEGMISMKQDGYMKVLEGISTMEEVLRVAQE